MSSLTGAPDLVEVHLDQVPVALWARSQEHFAELTREFALIAAARAEDRAHVPARLLELVDQLTEEYGEFSATQEQQLVSAAERGEPSIDLVFTVPRQAGAAVDALDVLLDEADAFCREGEHLLTLETPADCARYRRWYLAQFRTQLQGEPPVAWPQWTGGPRLSGDGGLASQP